MNKKMSVISPTSLRRSDLVNNVLIRWPYFVLTPIMITMVVDHLVSSIFQISILSILLIVLVELIIYLRKFSRLTFKLDQYIDQTKKDEKEINQYITPFLDALEVTSLAVSFANECDMMLSKRDYDSNKFDSNEISFTDQERDDDYLESAHRLNTKAIQNLGRVDFIVGSILSSEWINNARQFIFELDHKEKKKLWKFADIVRDRLKYQCTISEGDSDSITEDFERIISSAMNEPFDLVLVLTDIRKNVQKMIDARSYGLPEKRFSPSLTEALGYFVSATLGLSAFLICCEHFNCIYSDIIGYTTAYCIGMTKLSDWYFDWVNKNHPRV